MCGLRVPQGWFPFTTSSTPPLLLKALGRSGVCDCRAGFMVACCGFMLGPFPSPLSLGPQPPFCFQPLCLFTQGAQSPGSRQSVGMSCSRPRICILALGLSSLALTFFLGVGS